LLGNTITRQGVQATGTAAEFGVVLTNASGKAASPSMSARSPPAPIMWNSMRETAPAAI
jgi:hypothetical protein